MGEGECGLKFHFTLNIYGVGRRLVKRSQVQAQAIALLGKDPEQVVHTRASVSNQYNLVSVKRQ